MAAALGLCAGAGALADGAVTLASGVALQPLSAALDADVQALRLRYLAPEIGAPGFDLETLSAGMERLCRDAATGRALEQGALIIISISDRDVALGTMDLDAVQVFQSFEFTGDDCIWSDF
jgi:hypothetical protein